MLRIMENFQKLPNDLLCYILKPFPILDLEALSICHKWFAKFLNKNAHLYWGKWQEHTKRMRNGDYPKEKWEISIAKQFPKLYEKELFYYSSFKPNCTEGHGSDCVVDGLRAKAEINIGRKQTRWLDIRYD
jgi:hypothetical protein